jgi:hypothetical protein
MARLAALEPAVSADVGINALAALSTGEKIIGSKAGTRRAR